VVPILVSDSPVVTIPSHNNNNNANASGHCVSAYIRISTSIFGTEMENGSCPCDNYLPCDLVVIVHFIVHPAPPMASRGLLL
jgi:hypothetical protein